MRRDLDARHARDEFKAGWKTVLGGAVGMATGCSALPFYTLGVFVGPLSAAFGWSRSAISAVTICTMITNVVALPLAGRAADRFGPRPVALLSLAGASLCFFSFAFLNTSIWSFYMAWFALCCLGAGTYPPFWTRAVSTWFDKSRGLAIGLVLVGSGVASVIGPPLVAKAIDLWSWRGGFVVLGAIPAVIGLPLVYLFFHSAPAAGVSDTEREKPPGGISGAYVLKRRQFWHLALGIFLAGGAVAGFIVNLIPLISALGQSRAKAVGLASEMGFAVMGGRLLTGLLLDRAPVSAVGFGVFFTCGVAVFSFSAHPSLLLIQGGVVMVGLCAGAEVDLLTYAASRYFGMHAYAEITAWLFSIFAVGAGLAPIGANLLFEKSGSYALPLHLGGAFLMLASLAFATLGKASKIEPIAP